jgi:hypothetical protein
MAFVRLAKGGEMRRFTNNSEIPVNGHGLYRVWIPARSGPRMVLVARWIDPQSEKRGKQEFDELILEVTEEGPQSCQIVVRLRIALARESETIPKKRPGICNISVICP